MKFAGFGELEGDPRAPKEANGLRESSHPAGVATHLHIKQVRGVISNVARGIAGILPCGRFLDSNVGRL